MAPQPHFQVWSIASVVFLVFLWKKYVYNVSHKKKVSVETFVARSGVEPASGRQARVRRGGYESKINVELIW